jgi:hypothetical protein
VRRGGRAEECAGDKRRSSAGSGVCASDGGLGGVEGAELNQGLPHQAPC